MLTLETHTGKLCARISTSEALGDSNTYDGGACAGATLAVVHGAPLHGRRVIIACEAAPTISRVRTVACSKKRRRLCHIVRMCVRLEIAYATLAIEKPCPTASTASFVWAYVASARSTTLACISDGDVLHVWPRRQRQRVFTDLPFVSIAHCHWRGWTTVRCWRISETR
jgi:hypothetical protein